MSECGVVIGNYSVTYQQRNGGSGNTTVYSSNTSVTLQDIIPNAEYDVSVASISSDGDIGLFSNKTLFELQGDLFVFK